MFEEVKQHTAIFAYPGRVVMCACVCLHREVFILEDLKDTNIVQFMGACFDEGNAMLVTEFMAGGNLFDAIGADRSGKLCWYQRCALCCCCLLHQQPWCQEPWGRHARHQALHSSKPAQAAV